MALQIGFANVMFTLWDVSEETTYRSSNGKHFPSGTKTNYYYIGQLAKDKARAIAKAEEKGCTNLIPNEELKGQSRSYSTYTKIEIPEHQFKYGKFEGTDIKKCNDVDYLLWYGCDNSYVIERVLKISDLYAIEKNYNGFDQLLLKSDLVKRDIYTRIIEGEYELEAVSNFSYSDHEQNFYVKVMFDPQTDDEFEYRDKNQYGVQVLINANELDLQKRFYNGYEYWVPKGMRSFKGTKFTVKNEKITF